MKTVYFVFPYDKLNKRQKKLINGNPFFEYKVPEDINIELPLPGDYIFLDENYEIGDGLEKDYPEFDFSSFPGKTFKVTDRMFSLNEESISIYLNPKTKYYYGSI